jgi:ABC-type antimicrobial peptide transport system permease subunit
VPEVVRSIDQNLPVSAVRPFDQLLAGAVARRRFLALLLALFAAVALSMAALGIYSVTSYAVAQRRHEIGVRMAVGARARDVLGMILSETVRVVAAGVAIGLGGAFATGRMVSGLLYGVSALDPLTFTAISVLLASVALLASWLPARRAARVDPMVALRSASE